MAREREAGWNEFVEELCMRFRERSMADVIKEFKMLKQTGTVTEYLDEFEELRALLWTIQPHLTEQYFVSNFVSGLKGELRSMVKMMLLASVRQAAEKARLQELTLEAIFRKSRQGPKPNPQPSQPTGGYHKGPGGGAIVGPSRTTIGLPRGMVMEQRRQPGLCYRCGDRYTPGH